MTPLPQQLEDKKKEMIEIENAMEHFREKSPIQYDIWFHKFEIVVKEIAILEQAIAEIEKQRQEILEIIDNWGNQRLITLLTMSGFGYHPELEKNKIIKRDVTETCERCIKELKEKLNQPKTEKENSKQ